MNKKRPATRADKPQGDKLRHGVVVDKSEEGYIVEQILDLSAPIQPATGQKKMDSLTEMGVESTQVQQGKQAMENNEDIVDEKFIRSILPIFVQLAVKGPLSTTLGVSEERRTALRDKLQQLKERELKHS